VYNEQYRVRGIRIDEHIQNLSRLRRRTCFQNNNTSVLVYDDLVVQKTSKYPYKFDHEQFVGIFCINRVLRCIPNFTYTIPFRKPTGIFLEYIPGITLFDYIKSGAFNVNEWMFYMIQTLLAVSVAQRMCFFTHHDLCPWNIVLSPQTQEQAIDYIVGVDEIYRVYTTCVPVIIDYDKTHVVYDLQSFKHFFGFQPFQDTLCLFISSIYNIIRYQKLNDIDQKKLLFLFNQVITDPVYCPNVKTFADMVSFLNDAHKYAHISFSNKGKLTDKTPMTLIRLLMNQYRPGYSSQSKTRVINTVEKTNLALYTNLYRWNIQPNISQQNIHPILELYTKQLFELATSSEQDLQALEFEELERQPIQLNKVILPKFQVHTNQWASIPVYPAKYLEFLNILIEVVSQGGNYRLLTEERQSLIQELQTYLNTMDQIYSYSKVLINFKLSRNIL
jgi:serine/threonine protein kinase